MTRKKRQKRKDIFDIIQQAFSRLGWMVGLAIVLGAVVMGGGFYLIFSIIQEKAVSDWLLGLILGLVGLGIAGILAGIFITSSGKSTKANAEKALKHELRILRVANKRAQLLQKMSATLSDTLNFEQVMEVALDVSGIALEEHKVPASQMIGGIFLFEGDNTLLPIASRQLGGKDAERTIIGRCRHHRPITQKNRTTHHPSTPKRPDPKKLCQPTSMPHCCLCAITCWVSTIWCHDTRHNPQHHFYRRSTQPL